MPVASQATTRQRPVPGADRAQRDQGRVGLATVLWVSLVLGVTVQRAVPSLPAGMAPALQGVGVVAAGLIIFLRPAGTRRPMSVPPLLMLGFLLVPALGAVLALDRGQPGDCLNHVANGLTLVAVARLDVATLAESVRRSLLLVLVVSLVGGLVYAPFVDPSVRAFLPVIYDGRLAGLVGSPNVLGALSVLLICVCLMAFRGRRRAVGLTVALVSILATSSQTALGTASVLLLVAVLLRVRRSGDGALTAVVGIGALSTGVLAYLVWTIRSPVHDLGRVLSQISLSHRVDIWAFVLRQDIPFLGLGQSRIENLFENTVIPGATDVSSVHNMFLDGYARDGVLGLVAVVLLMLSIVAQNRRADLVLLPFTAFVVEGLLEVFPTHVPFLAITFALVLVATSRATSQQGRRHRAGGRPVSAGAVAT